MYVAILTITLLLKVLILFLKLLVHPRNNLSIVVGRFIIKRESTLDLISATSTTSKLRDIKVNIPELRIIALISKLYVVRIRNKLQYIIGAE